jgi:phosphate transport system permease protein
VAKAFIWGAAGITLTMLVLIVGYIIVNGLYTRRTLADPVMPQAHEVVPVSGLEGEGFAVMVNNSLRLTNIEYDELREIYLGLTGFWGFITHQNRNISAMVYAEETFADAVSKYFFGQSQGFGNAVQRVDAQEEILSTVQQNPGAVAIVPAEWVEEGRGFKTVGVRQTSVVVHPEIIALQAGRRLNSITEEQLRALLSGNADAWTDVGGPGIEIEPANIAEGDPGVYDPLPVRPVMLSEEAPEALREAQQGLGTLTFAEDAIVVDSVAAFETAMRETPGAVGLLRRPEVNRLELDVLEVEHVSHSVNLRPSFFVQAPSRAGEVGGISTIIINTVVMVLFVLLIATPIGLAAAVYLVEYAKQGRFLSMLRIGTDTLAGVPSIIFGLFGMVFFSQFLGLQTGLLAGTFTLTLMILPTVVRTSEEALKAVPDALREGSLALGGTKLQTIARVVVPAAAPGILTGVILGIGRAIGETAALLFTMGSNLAVVRSLNSPIRVLSVHLYLLIRENISIPNAFATATILVVIVLLVNFTTRRLIGRMNRLGVS